MYDWDIVLSSKKKEKSGKFFCSKFLSCLKNSFMTISEPIKGGGSFERMLGRFQKG